MRITRNTIKMGRQDRADLSPGTLSALAYNMQVIQDALRDLGRSNTDLLHWQITDTSARDGELSYTLSDIRYTTPITYGDASSVAYAVQCRHTRARVFVDTVERESEDEDEDTATIVRMTIRIRATF